MFDAPPANGDGIYITLAIVSCYVCLGSACLAVYLVWLMWWNFYDSFCSMGLDDNIFNG
jgi:hypothetical protein